MTQPNDAPSDGRKKPSPERASSEDVVRLVDEAILSDEQPLPHERQQPENASIGPFRLLHADKLDDMPPIRWLIQDEIPENSLVLLFGPSGVGKSFQALDYALRVAQGTAVVYIAAEGALGYGARKRAWCVHHAKSAGQLYFIPEAPNLLNSTEVEALIALIAPVQPTLVVVDTLARCMVGGDENSARDMGQFVASCDQIRHTTGATTLVVHHTGKSGLSERGSSALRAASDQVISISSEDGLIRLVCEKAKDQREFPPRLLRLVLVKTGRTQETGEPETSCVLLPSDKVILGDTLTVNGRMLLETLALETFRKAGGRSRALIEVTGMNSGTFYRNMSRLMNAGYVRQSERGDPYYLTQAGEDRLRMQ